MTRSHWYTSPDPPRFGENLVALCGEVVPKAQPVPAVWSDGEALMTCRKCDQGRASERYAAIIEAGQQAMDEERKG